MNPLQSLQTFAQRLRPAAGAVAKTVAHDVGAAPTVARSMATMADRPSNIQAAMHAAAPSPNGLRQAHPATPTMASSPATVKDIPTTRPGATPTPAPAKARPPAPNEAQHRQQFMQMLEQGYRDNLRTLDRGKEDFLTKMRGGTAERNNVPLSPEGREYFREQSTRLHHDDPQVEDMLMGRAMRPRQEVALPQGAALSPAHENELGMRYYQSRGAGVHGLHTSSHQNARGMGIPTNNVDYAIAQHLDPARQRAAMIPQAIMPKTAGILAALQLFGARGLLPV